MTDEAQRKRILAEKEHASRLMLAKLNRVLAGSGLSAHEPTVLVDIQHGRVDCHVRVSHALSQLVREE